MNVSAQVDERTLRETYLTAFEQVVKKAQPWTIMCSYNRINGTYSCEYDWLLNKVLRDEWGFKGFVMTDWGGGISQPALSICAGNDMIQPGGVTDEAFNTYVRGEVYRIE